MEAGPFIFWARMSAIGGKSGHRRDIAQLLATVQRSIRRESILYFFSVKWLRTGWRLGWRWRVIIGVLS